MANSHPGSYTGQDAYNDMLVAGKENDVQYIVRRLTPTECARLQGFPDLWGHLDEKAEFSDAEYRFWLNVRNTHAAINGKQTKDYSVEQMLKWYSKLHTDSAEYKMWGNGIALPCALYVTEGIQDAIEREENNAKPL
jgi:DNA (cytosine-5)-methyltransferase 1